MGDLTNPNASEAVDVASNGPIKLSECYTDKDVAYYWKQEADYARDTLARLTAERSIDQAERLGAIVVARKALAGQMAAEARAQAAEAKLAEVEAAAFCAGWHAGKARDAVLSEDWEAYRSNIKDAEHG